MKVWTYDPSPTVGMTFSESMAYTPREDLLLAGTHLAWSYLMRFVIRVYFRLKVDGRQHVPKKGPFIVVANHSSHADELVLQSSMPKRIAERIFPVVAQDYFFATALTSFLSAAFLNAVPLDRHRQSRHGLDVCENLLGQGYVLIVFPEGSRSSDGTMGGFKRGIGWLVAGTDYPVVPAYIRGTHRAWPKGSRVPRPLGVGVTYGEPQDFSGFPRDATGFSQVTQQLERAVMELSERRCSA